jgi:hypothetical protein
MEPESFTWLTATLPNGECGGQLGLLAQTLESDRRPSVVVIATAAAEYVDYLLR